MKKLFCAAFTYLIAGLASGLYYRELTKHTEFPDAATTQLSVAHTHLLTLGFLALLLVLALEGSFDLSRSRLFPWFFWTYNAGVIVTSGMLVWHGTLTVLGQEGNAMTSGIAGLGHILLTVGTVLLFLALRPAVNKAVKARTIQGTAR
ncbi:MAG TPA: DUF2871 domain-containing protein [Candidatus Agrococcus pullicola]|uniref:DUF2871 domain-containing protein n=1 Tax=Candidatus Agrococcus pullicola TaxID=2838429 RepID=A0A9D2CAB9_9MICO|nr:DUF2871 domain-containing protein [Candidatus Agrococcus pullicola]